MNPPKKKDTTNPWGLEFVPYERYIVQFVDALIDVANKNGSKGYVQSTLDWQTINFMWRGFEALFPISSQAFIEQMKKVRLYSKHKAGIAREGEAMIQYQMEVPEPFYKFMNIIFPDQKWDKKFIKELTQILPQLKAAEKI